MIRFDPFGLLCNCLSVSSTPRDDVRLRRQLSDGGVDWPRVMTLASEQLVTPAIFPALGKRGLSDCLPGDARNYFEAFTMLNRERNQGVRRQVEWITRMLNARGVEPLLLKGTAHLFAELFQDEGTRFMQDIDLLVPIERALECAQVLKGEGYQELPNAEIAQEVDKHLPILKHPLCDIGVELHRHLVNPEFRAILPADSVWQESEPLNAGGLRLRLPSLRHRLIHHVIHTELQHAHQAHRQVSLRHLLDACELGRRVAASGSWSEIRHTFAEHGWEDVLRSYLYVGHRLLGAEMPPEIGRTLRSTAHYWQVSLCHRSESLLAARLLAESVCRRTQELATGELPVRRLGAKLLEPGAYSRAGRRLWQVIRNPG